MASEKALHDDKDKKCFEKKCDTTAFWNSRPYICIHLLMLVARSPYLSVVTKKDFAALRMQTLGIFYRPSKGSSFSSCYLVYGS